MLVRLAKPAQALKAGVKPVAIARQFGISQTDVKRALAGELRKVSH